MERDSRRQHKLAELLKVEISRILQREVKNPRLRWLTVTEVQLRGDLKAAEVFVCRLAQDPTEEEGLKIVKGLESASSFVYEKLKKHLCLRVVPSLKFHYDRRIEQMSQIWQLTQKDSHGLNSHGLDSHGLDSHGLKCS